MGDNSEKVSGAFCGVPETPERESSGLRQPSPALFEKPSEEWLPAEREPFSSSPRAGWFLRDATASASVQLEGFLVLHPRIETEPPTEEVQGLNQDYQGSPSKRIFSEHKFSVL